PLAADPSPTSPPRPGTHSQPHYARPRTSSPSGDSSRHGSSNDSSTPPPPQRLETLM
ncbi:hypothetical protein NDU88_005335, partial [Pleurodeles waltl]